MEQNLILERAHHQAGRAVVCITLFGARVVKQLEMDGLPGSAAGFETYSKLPVPLSCRPPSHKRGEERKPIPVEGIVDAHGVLAYAGIAAEYEFQQRTAIETSGEGLTNFRETGSESREQLAKLASSIGLERPADHFYEEYWNEALRLLNTSWHAVESVAETLTRHQALNGRRIDALILGDEAN